MSEGFGERLGFQPHDEDDPFESDGEGDPFIWK